MCHAYPPYTGAGAETTLHDFLRATADAGHEVEVLLSENRGPAQRYEIDGVQVWPHRGTGDPFAWFGTDRQPHVVVSQLQNVNRAAALASQHGVPLAQVVHNEQMHTRHQIRVGPADLVVYNAEWVRAAVTRWLEAHELALPTRELVLHPPVRIEDYRIDAPGEHITMINLASIKGADVFYALARRMPERQFLGVVGYYGQQHIEGLDNVEIIGPVPPQEMRERVYARTKVLLVPSPYESYGRVSVEACCAGLPVIASQAPGLVEALGPDGTCVDREDLDTWEKTLRRVLTARGWAAAARRARTVADELTTDADLKTWVAELEAVAAVPVQRR